MAHSREEGEFVSTSPHQSPALFLAPAATGKTRYALDLIRQQAGTLRGISRLCVANRQQALSCQRRLASAGGVLGVEVLTFDQLYQACLSEAGVRYTQIEDTVEFRLLRSLVGRLPLQHFDSLRNRPGFIQALQPLIEELKSAGITPQHFLTTAEQSPDRARLMELGHIYQAFEEHLQQNQWSDYSALGQLALEALRDHAPTAARGWPLLVIDGFDSFTQTQMELLKILAQRVQHLVITLTGDHHATSSRRVYRRYDRTRRELETILQLEARPLPALRPAPTTANSIEHLARHMFDSPGQQLTGDGQLELVAAPDHAAEVRAAFRWLKQKLVEGDAKAHEMALLARDLEPYRPFIRQMAAEFGIPIYLLGGIPLQQNPCVAAVLNLLSQLLPSDNEPLSLQRRALLTALRSPYFDWQGAAGLSPADIDTLDALARRGRVLGGPEQWFEAFDLLIGREPAASEQELSDDETEGAVGRLPSPQQARILRDKFENLLTLLTPPEGKRPFRDFVVWLEDLLGEDEAGEALLEDQPLAFQPPSTSAPESLRVIQQARSAEPDLVRRDINALHKFKSILRGLLWAEEAGIVDERVTYRRFFEELYGAVEASSYETHAAGDALLVADLHNTRGVPFHAVAVLGLAEGLFPAVLTEDPFLHETDRDLLRETTSRKLESSIESAEAQFFYDAVTRAGGYLLLTRPRLAEGGAVWQPSPFWEEVKRLVAIEPIRLESEQAPLPQSAASQPELVESLCADGREELQELFHARYPDRWLRLLGANRILLERFERRESNCDGYLHEISDLINQQFGKEHVWSATRLERYRTCPHYFYIADVLQQEARQEPEAGLDARQLGSIYHHLLEQAFSQTAPEKRTDPAALEATLDAIAPAYLAQAPEREGFRVTAWWQQTKEEVLNNLRQSLREMVAITPGFMPTYFELKFFDGSKLTVHDGDDCFHVHGIIDRIDVNEEGDFCVVDYKTAGPGQYSMRDLHEGRRLQLALYALAARDALNLGQPIEGYYWHVQQAEASPLKLSRYEPELAIETAVSHAWSAVRGIRDGAFVPSPPNGGCPSYCPAAAFCWHYEPRTW